MRWLLTTFLSFLSPLLDSLPPNVFFTCVLISVVSQAGKCPLSQPSHVHPGNSSFRLFPIRGRAVVNRISLESSGYVRCCHCHCQPFRLFDILLIAQPGSTCAAGAKLHHWAEEEAGCVFVFLNLCVWIFVFDMHSWSKVDLLRRLAGWAILVLDWGHYRLNRGHFFPTL